MGSVRPTGSRACRRALSDYGCWHVERRSGTPGVLHSWSVGAPFGGHKRLVRVCQALSAALVLGSAESESDADPARCRAAHLEIVRRRSGGGAVLVAPGSQLWVDVFLPRDDELFSKDVSSSFVWLGEAWAEAIDRVVNRAAQDGGARAEDATGRSLATVHRGRPVMPEVASRLCFLGAVPGEVFLKGRKIVGCSQRRDRLGAWFHTMALLEHDPARLTAVMSFRPDEALVATRLLEESAGTVTGGRAIAPELEAALLEAIANR